MTCSCGLAFSELELQVALLSRPAPNNHRAVEPVLTANAPPSPSSATNFPRRMISPSAVQDFAQTATTMTHAYSTVAYTWCWPQRCGAETPGTRPPVDGNSHGVKAMRVSTVIRRSPRSPPQSSSDRWAPSRALPQSPPRRAVHPPQTRR